MERAIVSLAVKRLGDLLIEEAIFLYGMSDKVEKIQNELRRMQCFLIDADVASTQDEKAIVRNLVAEIREAAYDAEDVIDTFAFEVAMKRRRRGLLNALNRYACILSECRALHKVGTKIDDIKNRLSSLAASLQRYDTRSIGDVESSSSRNERRQLLRRTYSHVIDEDIVGVEKSLEILVEELVRPDKRSSLVSICGLGGLGKTTLAKQVYHDVRVRRHFDCFAWSSVSQQFNFRSVIQGILIKLMSVSKGEIEEMSDDEVFKKVYQIQENKKCLVILDDVWRADHWDALRPAFPLHNLRSKILITTRNKAVALHADPHGFLYQPNLLTEKESWELLQKKAFPRDDDGGKEKLGKEMAKCCDGLPLAIIVLGGLLATKHTSYEWETVHRNLKSYLGRGHGQGVSNVLALSYQDLPYHLKPCFLYLAHFPEDYEIPRNALVQMWAAEGITSTEAQEETLEDVGELYLGELIDRHMVQVGARSWNGRVKICRLHDLMRDLCLSIVKEENFLEIINLQQGETILSTTTSNKVRRCAIYLDQDFVSKASEGLFEYIFKDASRYENFHLEHLRSLLVFRCPGHWMTVESAFNDFKLLRVLSLEGIRLSESLSTIGDLVHLRFLSFKDAWLSCFPSFIGNLRFIQTLDLRVYYLYIGYKDINYYNIGNLIYDKKWLRHLYLPPDSELLRWHTRRRNLQTPKNFEERLWAVRDLAQLTKLQKLEIGRIPSFKELQIILNPSCPISRSLRSLCIYNVRTKMEETELMLLSTCQRLYKLWLNGEINTLPEHPCFPPSLTKLTLVDSRLSQDPTPILERLPNLSILNLGSRSYMGKEMTSSANGFPQLIFLGIYLAPHLERLKVHEGAMPRLRSLQIGFCDALEKVPDGLRYITTLEELKIYEMPIFENRLQKINGEEGEDFDIVRHVPSISFPYMTKKFLNDRSRTNYLGGSAEEKLFMVSQIKMKEIMVNGSCHLLAASAITIPAWSMVLYSIDVKNINCSGIDNLIYDQKWLKHFYLPSDIDIEDNSKDDYGP